MDEVAADTVAIIAKCAKHLPAGKRNLSMTDRLVEDLGIDSMSAAVMIFDLEEKFDVQIPFNSNDSRPELQTVGDIIEAIKKLAGKS